MELEEVGSSVSAASAGCRVRKPSLGGRRPDGGRVDRGKKVPHMMPDGGSDVFLEFLFRLVFGVLFPLVGSVSTTDVLSSQAA